MAFVINRVLLVLLGVMTGLVKLFFMADEMVIFRDAGFPDAATVAFGVVQIGGALACVHPKSRFLGSLVLGGTFVAATGVLFVNGLYAFGVFSLLFVAMAGAEAYSTRR